MDHYSDSPGPDDQPLPDHGHSQDAISQHEIIDDQSGAHTQGFTEQHHESLFPGTMDYDLAHDPHGAAQAIWGEAQGIAHVGHGEAESVTGLSILDGLDALNQVFEPSAFPGYQEFNEVHGTPLQDMSLWEHQQEPFSCAVATTDMLFRSFGLDVGEPMLAKIFQAEGIYDPATGTNPHMIADVINDVTSTAGLNIHAVEIPHFTEGDLEQMLDAGIRPLIGVNATELYDSGDRLLNEIGILPDAGHAVQLTGIIKNAAGEFAVLNDPGIPDGGGFEIPLSLLMDAASDYGFDAVAMYSA